MKRNFATARPHRPEVGAGRRFPLPARFVGLLRRWHPGWPFAERLDFKYLPWP